MLDIGKNYYSLKQFDEATRYLIDAGRIVLASPTPENTEIKDSVQKWLKKVVRGKMKVRSKPSPWLVQDTLDTFSFEKLTAFLQFKTSLDAFFTDSSYWIAIIEDSWRRKSFLCYKLKYVLQAISNSLAI